MNEPVICVGREEAIQSGLDLLDRVGRIRITGGPGAGKSTYLGCLLRAFQERHGPRAWTLRIAQAGELTTWSMLMDRFERLLEGPPARAEGLGRWRRSHGKPADLAAMAAGGEEAGPGGLLLMGLDEYPGGDGGSVAVHLQRLEEELGRQGFEIRYAIVEREREGPSRPSETFLGRPLLNLFLGPPVLEDLEALARKLELPEHLRQNLLKLAEQPWKAIHEFLRQAHFSKAGDYWHHQAASLLQGMTAEEQEWCHRLSLLEDFAEDLLGLFFKEEERERVGRWLSTRMGEYLSHPEGRSKFLDPLAAAIRRGYHRDRPEDYRRDAARAEQVNGLVSVAPQRGQRETLCQLLHCNFFSRELLREVWGGEAEAMVALLEMRPDLFLRGDRGYRLRPDVKLVAQSYAEAVGWNMNPEILARFEGLWNDKRDWLQQSLEDTTALIRNQERELQRLEAWLQNRPMPGEGAGSGTRSPTGRPLQGDWLRVTSGMLLQAVGIGLVYLDLMVKENLSFANVAAGTLLVLLGVSRFRDPARARGGARVVRPTAEQGSEESGDSSRGERVLVRERRKQIEDQLRRTRAHLQLVHQLLKEPYVARSRENQPAEMQA